VHDSVIIPTFPPHNRVGEGEEAGPDPGAQVPAEALLEDGVTLEDTTIMVPLLSDAISALNRPVAFE